MKMKNIKKYSFLIIAVGALSSLTSCYDTQQKASPDSTTESTGTEYAPQMYYAESYEPLSQIVDKEAGMNHWPFKYVGGGVSDYDTTMKDGHGEFYNSNYYNEFGMNMKQPVAGTVAQGQQDFKYNIHKNWTLNHFNF